MLLRATVELCRFRLFFRFVSLLDVRRLADYEQNHGGSDEEYKVGNDCCVKNGKGRCVLFCVSIVSFLCFSYCLWEVSIVDLQTTRTKAEAGRVEGQEGEQ